MDRNGYGCTAALEEPLPTTVAVVRSLTCCSGRNSHLSQENLNNHAPEQLVLGLFHPTAEGGHNTAKAAGISEQKRTNKRPGSVRALGYLGSCFPLPDDVCVLRWKAKRPGDKVQQSSEFNHLNSACFLFQAPQHHLWRALAAFLASCGFLLTFH